MLAAAKTQGPSATNEQPNESARFQRALTAERTPEMFQECNPSSNHLSTTNLFYDNGLLTSRYGMQNDHAIRSILTRHVLRVCCLIPWYNNVNGSALHRPRLAWSHSRLAEMRCGVKDSDHARAIHRDHHSTSPPGPEYDPQR